MESQISHQVHAANRVTIYIGLLLSRYETPREQADTAALVFAHADLLRSGKTSLATLTCPVMSAVKPEFLVS